MLNVIPFKPDRRRRPERVGPATEAEILFFTGVRYERYAEAEEAADVAMLLIGLESGCHMAPAEDERLLA